MTNREIAQEISNRIGTAPVPFDSVYSIALQIYNELGGEQTQFDSVYSILLEILPLVEGGIKPIEEVSELPNAEENKDKFYRLDNGEKDVYAAKLLSSETITTNRLPDAQQIDKAYLYANDGWQICYYKGATVLHCSDGDVNGYLWYRDDDIFYISKDNAEIININSLVTYGEDLTNYSIVDGDVYTDDAIDNVEWDIYTFIPIPAIYNAPESAQIGNATLIEIKNGENGIYNGQQITFEYNNEQITGYKWTDLDDDTYCMATDKPASEIYFYYDEDNDVYYTDTKLWYISLADMSSEEDNFHGLYIPQLNAPDSEQVGKASVFDDDVIETPCFYTGREVTLIANNGTFSCYLWEDTVNDSYVFTKVNAENAYMGAKIKYSSESFVSEKGDDLFETSGNVEEVSFNTYNSRLSTVKYQRTEVTEEWDWEKVATEQYVDDAIAEIPQLEAGQNVEIADNKINAIGYKAENNAISSFVELPEYIVEPFNDITSQLPSTDLYFTGDAGSTQYTVSGQLLSMIPSMVGFIAFQVGSGNIAKFISFDSDNSTVTLDKSLDDNNALSSAQLSKIYMVVNVLISGAANATTYSYIDNTGGAFSSLTSVGSRIKIGDYTLVTVTEITNNTITFDETLDTENAVSNARWEYTLFLNNSASGINAHAEGKSTTASGNYSHAEGNRTTASGNYGSHAEGNNTTASGMYSHAEGNNTTASGMYSHAEGQGTTASGNRSHAEGNHTTAQNDSEHAEGSFNVSHTGNASNEKTQHSIGIGEYVSASSTIYKNAFEVMANGDMYVLGVGGYQGTNTKVQDATIKTLQEYIASLEARIAALENPNA